MDFGLAPAKENLYNCLELFGFDKTADFCLEEQAVTSDKISYPLKNKYQCLSAITGPGSNVNIQDEAAECLSLFFDYKVEQCLEKMEAEYNDDMGFTGSLQPPASDDSLSWKDEFFASYGNRSSSVTNLAVIQLIEES